MIADDEQDTARPGGIDPRYDPAFQRGYQPQPGERPRTRVRAAAPATTTAPARERSRADLGDDSDLFSETAGSAGSAWEATTSVAPDLSSPSFPATASYVLAAPSTAASAEPASAPAVYGPGILAGAELSPRRNPLMLALWIVGAGLVVLGVVIYAVAVNASYTTSYTGSGGDVGMQVLTQIGWVLAGPMITIGILTMVALLFLSAIVGRRRAPVPADVDGDFDADDDEL
ncbi:hypothetical protein ACFVU2_03280 [Leifsonia sp. NPDC058194]|uniref:hypothetical protein n=1 Tax=Leifsonia sp. NPDC058194 TaxID=3346374 RepID=UPI0036DE3B61